MSAATKPRAKSAKTVKSEDGVLTRLRAVQDKLRSAEQMVTQAYDAAPPGEPIEIMLRHVTEELLVGNALAILHDTVTQAEADVNFEALFYPIAVLEGAIALTAGTVMHHNLIEAQNLLDLVQEDLALGASGLRRLLPPQTKAAGDFQRGRRLAVEMLHEGQALWDSDDAEALRRHREGRAQNRFAKGALSQLIDEPELLDGFAAILSARLGVGDIIMDASSFGDLPASEFEAGEVGADGTEGDEQPIPPAVVQPQVVERAQPVARPAGPSKADAEESLTRAKEISALVRWITLAREECDKLSFWMKHSPAFAAATEHLTFSPPEWEGHEALALFGLMYLQQDSIETALAHLEGGAS